jgi:citrate lyase subunit beta/citryl-CoA lyase
MQAAAPTPSSVYRRRSVLYVPASNEKAMGKVASLPCDAVIFDLEDSVAPDTKAEARETLLSYFGSGVARSDQQRVIRANLADGFVEDADLDLVVGCGPDALLIPKVESAELLLRTREALDSRGARDTRLWAMIETPRGIVEIGSIASRSTCQKAGLDCIVVGTNDIAKDTSVPLPRGRAIMLHWLATIVIHAKAAGIDVIDGVFNDFNDDIGFLAECHEGALSGFDGKSLIHPRQIVPANEAYSPSASAVSDARYIVEAFADPTNKGKGVIVVNGKMTELLHLEIARTVLAKVG